MSKQDLIKLVQLLDVETRLAVQYICTNGKLEEAKEAEARAFATKNRLIRAIEKQFTSADPAPAATKGEPHQ